MSGPRPTGNLYCAPITGVPRPHRRTSRGPIRRRTGSLTRSRRPSRPRSPGSKDRSQLTAAASGHMPPPGFRRPPAAPARRALPAGFRRPPAAPARQSFPGGVARPPVKLTDPSSIGRTAKPPRKDGEYDREVVAAITTGDPAGIAMAYDRYAPALYGYSHWILHDSAAAAGALKDTFVIAAATLSRPVRARQPASVAVRTGAERMPTPNPAHVRGPRRGSRCGRRAGRCDR